MVQYGKVAIVMSVSYEVGLTVARLLRCASKIVKSSRAVKASTMSEFGLRATSSPVHNPGIVYSG